MPHIIVNADDFGRSSVVNAAVIQAHREGVLTSASLMVTGEAVDEAVRLAKQHPSLAVGLHVVASNAPPALPPEHLPHIVDEAGWFPDDPTQVGWHYFRSAAARRELARELRAQFEFFADTGLPLSHVDGHHHLHVHPTIFPMVLPLALEFGAQGFRLPRDDVALAMTHERSNGMARIARGWTFALLSRWCLNALRRTRLKVVDRAYGLLQSGRMHESYLLRVLREVRAPTIELYCHPATRFEGDALGPNPEDLRALISPRVREALHEGGHQLATYSSLQAVTAA